MASIKKKKKSSPGICLNKISLAIRRLFVPAALLSTQLLTTQYSLATPQGGVVTHGSASIQQNLSTTTVTQNSNRALLVSVFLLLLVYVMLYNI